MCKLVMHNYKIDLGLVIIKMKDIGTSGGEKL